MLAELLQEASVVRAFAEIEAHHEDLVQLIIRLCEIASPTFAEGPRARAVAEELRTLGLQDVHLDEANNVIGVLPGSEQGQHSSSMPTSIPFSRPEPMSECGVEMASSRPRALAMILPISPAGCFCSDWCAIVACPSREH
jgi:hypothetical protein